MGSELLQGQPQGSPGWIPGIWDLSPGFGVCVYFSERWKSLPLNSPFLKRTKAPCFCSAIKFKTQKAFEVSLPCKQGRKGDKSRDFFRAGLPRSLRLQLHFISAPLQPQGDSDGLWWLTDPKMCFLELFGGGGGSWRWLCPVPPGAFIPGHQGRKEAPSWDNPCSGFVLWVHPARQLRCNRLQDLVVGFPYFTSFSSQVWSSRSLWAGLIQGGAQAKISR